MRNMNSTMVINVCVEANKFMLKYFRGYHRPTKINQHECFLTHENFPIYGI